MFAYRSSKFGVMDDSLLSNYSQHCLCRCLVFNNVSAKKLASCSARYGVVVTHWLGVLGEPMRKRKRVFKGVI